MHVDNKDIGAVGLVLTLLGFFYRGASNQGALVKRVGVLEEFKKDIVKQLGVLDDDIEAEVERAMSGIDSKIEGIEARVTAAFKYAEKIDKRFVTVNGEPRYVSYKAYDKIQENCQHHLLAEMGHVRESVGKMDEQIEGFSAKMQTVLEQLAVLGDRNKKGA